MREHLGLIGGLGVGATTLYYERIAAALAARNVVPRMTIAHAHAPNALALVTAGRIDDMADYLAGFADELAAAVRRSSPFRPSRRTSAGSHCGAS